MRPCLGGGTILKPVGNIQELYDASRVYFGTARNGVNDGIIQAAIHEGIKDLRIAKQLSRDKASDRALIASAEDAFRQLGYSEKRIEGLFVKGGNNPIEELIEKLLESDDINLRNKAFQFTDVAADNVGSVAVRKSARAMGEMLYYQNIFGIDQKNLIGLDVFASNLKMAIGGDDTSDVYAVAQELLAGFDKAEAVSGVENSEDLIRQLGSIEKRIAATDFFEKIQSIREAVDKVDDAFADEAGKPYGALKQLKTALIQNFGRTEENTVLSLSDDIETVSDSIRRLQNSKVKLAANQLKLKAEIEKGILKREAADQTDEFLANIIADSEKVKDLDEMNSLRGLVSSLSKKERISSASKMDLEDFARLQNLFGLVVPEKPPMQLGKSEIAEYIDQANYVIGDRSNKFKTEILGYLDTASKRSDLKVQDMVERLKVLHRETLIGPTTSGLEESSRAKRVFASIIDDLFNAQSRRS